MRKLLLAALLCFAPVRAWSQFPTPTFDKVTLPNAPTAGTDATNKTYVDTHSFGSLASPPPIGNTTPNTGAFSTVTSGESLIKDTGTQTSGTVLNVPTFAALRAFQPDALTKTATAQTEGFARAGDGGGATYDWDSTNTCNVNGSNVVCVLPTGSTHATTGRWRLRMTTGGVDIRSNGAKCDGVTDDSTAINNLMTNVSQFGGGDVVIPVTMAAAGVSGCVVSGANLSLKSGVRLRGAFNPFGGPQGFAAYTNSSLLLDPSKSIVVVAGSTMSDLLVWRLGLASKPANVSDVFAAVTQWQADNSTAVTVTCSSMLERVRIIGFTLAIKQQGCGDNWLRDVQFDGINGFERIAANAVTNLENMQANSWWASGFGGRQGVVTATPTAGTGYTTGDTVQPSGGTCTVRPVFTVTASGGVPGSLAITNVGDCTALPTGATFTGGTGTGLTATLSWRSGGYRPGIGVYDHDGIELLMTGALFEQFSTGIKVSNSSLNVFTNILIEGAGNVNFQSVGIDTENCAENSIVNSTVTANWTNILANAKTDVTAATCNAAGGNNNVVGLTKIYGGHVNGAQTITNSSIVVGPSASVYVSGLRISSGNLSGASMVTVAADGRFTASGLIFTPISNHNPWITADATATVTTCGGIGDGSATLASIGYADTCASTAGGIFSGATTIGTNTAAATLAVNGPAGAQRIFQWSTAGSPRWRFLTNATAEGGSNAGSDLQLFSFSDAGASIGSTVFLTRSNGNWTWNNNNNFLAPVYNFHGVVNASTDSFQGAGDLASASGIPFNPGSASKPVLYALTNYTGVWDTGGTSPYFFKINDAISAEAASFIPTLWNMDFEYNTGAGNGRTPFVVNFNKNAISTIPTVDNTFVVATIKGNVNINEGDSSTYRGDYEALNLDLQCKADWLRGCNQAEIDHGLFAGMHARSLFHVVLINQTNDRGHGAYDDAFIGFLGGSPIPAGTGQRTNIFQLGAMLNTWPLDPSLSNSAILTIHPFRYNDPFLANLGQPVSPPQYYAGFGFDLFYLNATTAVIRSPGWAVDGGGQQSMGPTTLTYDASGNATLAVTRLRETSATITAGGDHYTVGDELADTVGGLWTVATAPGRVVATVTQLQPGYTTSCPGAGTATTAGSGQNVTLNISCASLGNLILGASTHNVQVGGGSALATNATTGFLQVPTMAGTPTGICGAAGKACIVIDTSGKKLWYSIGGGTWEASGAFIP